MTADEWRPEVSEELNRALRRMWASAEADRNGSARQAMWMAEDGWVIVYTTTRVEGGPHDGRFAVIAYKPVGKGSRGGRGKATEWTRHYWRGFATRKAAKARAVALYRQHSPKWAARVPVECDL